MPSRTVTRKKTWTTVDYTSKRLPWFRTTLAAISSFPTMDGTAVCWSKASVISFIKGLGRCWVARCERLPHVLGIPWKISKRFLSWKHVEKKKFTGASVFLQLHLCSYARATSSYLHNFWNMPIGTSFNSCLFMSWCCICKKIDAPVCRIPLWAENKSYYLFNKYCRFLSPLNMNTWTIITYISRFMVCMGCP